MHDDHAGGRGPAEAPLVSESYRARGGDYGSGDDGNTSLALAAGLIAGLVAGGVWALIVIQTGYEIGFVAWGVGLLVGFAMSRLTASRSTGLAVAAASFAAIGLLAGKLLIGSFGAGTLADALLEDDQFFTQAVIQDMVDQRSFNEATLEEYDATVAADDTLSDALWDQMVAQARTRMATMSEEERSTLARSVADQVYGSQDLVGRIRNQMTGWDLLWFLLAVSTAYGMMKASDPEGAAAV